MERQKNLWQGLRKQCKIIVLLGWIGGGGFANVIAWGLFFKDLTSK